MVCEKLLDIAEIYFYTDVDVGNGSILQNKLVVNEECSYYFNSNRNKYCVQSSNCLKNIYCERNQSLNICYHMNMFTMFYISKTRFFDKLPTLVSSLQRVNTYNR